MWGKLVKTLCIETINEDMELCHVYFPKGIYIELNISEKENEHANIDEQILKDVVSEIKKDDECGS